MSLSLELIAPRSFFVFVLCMVLFHEFVPGVSSPKGSWGGQCCRDRQQVKVFFRPRGIVPQGKLFVSPRGFVPQGKLGRPMLPRSPAGEGILLSPGFRPPGETLRQSSGICLPSKSGAAWMMPRSPAGVGWR